MPVVLQMLRDQIGQYIYPIHRLDGGTSGCLVFALSSESANLLQQQLQEDSAVKRYIALCKGHLPQEGRFDRQLTGENKIKKDALTLFKLIQTFNGLSLLDVQIKTGRKHQIRRHLSFEGHHIVGDVNHGKGWFNRKYREEYGFHRLFLHCHRLEFIHPVSKVGVVIDCPLPAELTELLDQLKEQ